MKNSLPDHEPSATVTWRLSRNWDLWSLRRTAIAYILSVELAVAIAAIWLLPTLGSTTTTEWFRFAALVLAVTVHLTIVRRAEESRRDESAGPYFDLTSVWTFAAAIVLPAAMAVLVAVWLRIVLWPIARRQPYRFVFTSAHIVASTVLANAAVHLSGLSLAASGQFLMDLALLSMLVVVAALYWFVQVLLMTVALKIVNPQTRFVDSLGSRNDNMLEMTTLGVGAMLGMLVATHWVAPLLLAVPVILVNALLHRASERQAHLERLVAEQHKAHLQLTKDAHTDYRTGLFNTNGFSEHANRLTERCRHAGQPVAVLAIDLDHFKRINDTWGHPAGNAVLAEVGRILREKLRPGDVAGRDGGEEFVVVLADTGLTQGTAIAERVREAIAEMSVVTTDKHRNTVTLRGRNLPLTEDGPEVRAISASIGVAVVPDNGDCLMAAHHSADAALYTAKENGRNQVRVAGIDLHPRRLPAPRVDEPEVTRSA
ncbi:diguanylate cyclase (GGDEF)-like protein [Saccharothrix australiensis]|uniref:Diguanylate cyclase (GGDEF)-like protein n=1 Tax=Saccharothrix australiensis TaxID=2072 RepID=A0A495VX59_9PSEU|nr:diguanylate cyclase (GGDEF)-like protein [Saccharothrix australiensis]